MHNPRRDEQNLLGESPAWMEALEQLSLAAPLNRPVLLIGERGTGKELLAQRLHFLSLRWGGPWVKLNCATLTETLLESELFGHEAGAFTGAQRKHQGRFELADGGSLFLDEVATTSGRVQEKLLRVIEYGEFERVGGNRTLQVDVRIIAATNEDLPQLAEAGRFRHDLLDRLAFDVITLPPLRARPEDIPLLAEHFARRMCAELEREHFPGFSRPALHKLQEYHWPGNVRELKNVVERAVYRTPDDETVEEIQFDPFDSPWRPASGKPDGGTQPGLPLELKPWLLQQEKALVQQALEQARFNQKKAATLLGLTYDQLRGLLKKHRLLQQDEPAG